MKKLLLAILFFCMSACAGFTIAIQPFGFFDQKLIDSLIPHLETRFKGVSIEVLPPKEIPACTFYKPRNRYRAELILDYLDSTTSMKYQRVIGLLQKDISTTKGEHYDWGIFGLGRFYGFSCVVSTFRMQKNVSKEELLQRLKKVAVHEIGHTFGLDHCSWPNCVMTDYKGTIKSLDQSGFRFCNRCFTRVNDLLTKYGCR